MPRARVSCAVAGTEAANSGPRMISAPSASACWVTCCAPCGLPPSSLIRSWMFGFWNSASAISAAFFIDCAATPALPAAESGRIRPTLTCPLPTASGCCCGPAGPSGWGEPNGLETLLHAGAGAEQRRAENKTDRRPPGRSRRPRIRRSRLAIERAYHLVSSLDRPPSARIPAFWAKAPEPLLNPDAGFRHIVDELVNQNKRIMAPRRRRRCGTSVLPSIPPDPSALVALTLPL